MARLRIVWLDPRRVLPLHEVKRVGALREIITRMKSRRARGLPAWEGAPLPVEKMHGGRHYLSWAGTHRLAAARALRLRKIPCVLTRKGKAAKGLPLGAYTTSDLSRYHALRSRRDPAAALMRHEIVRNAIATRYGVL